MKVEIKRNGILIIMPQTELEAYALKKWMDDNIGTPERENNLKDSLLVDLLHYKKVEDDDDLPF